MDHSQLPAIEAEVFPIFDAHPFLLGSLVRPALYAAAALKGMSMADVDQVLKDYADQHTGMAALTDALAKIPDAVPAATPEAPVAVSTAPQAEGRVAYLLRTDTTGNLAEVVGPSDPHGYIKLALCKYADNENVPIAILAQIADKQYSLRDTMATDANLLIADALSADPDGRTDPRWETLFGQFSIDPSSMPAPQRCRDVTAPGWHLVLAEGSDA